MMMQLQEVEQSPDSDREKLLTPWLFTLSPAFRFIVGRLRTDFAPLPDTAFVRASDAIVEENLW